MSDIDLLNKSYPYVTNIIKTNKALLQVEGIAQGGETDKEEINDLYNVLGLNKAWARDITIGHTSGTYNNWTHVKDKSGFSIWKYNVSDYAYNSGNKMFMNEQILDFMGQASSVSLTAFDRVLTSGTGGFVDVTTEAASELGTAFNLLTTTDDYLYIGHSGTYAGWEMNFNTYGRGHSLFFEYWNNGWSGMSIAAENTQGWTGNGTIDINSEVALGQTSVNGETLYWTRASTLNTPSTVAKAYYLSPKNNVVSLINMTSADIGNGDWKWCSSGQDLYVGIPNNGFDYHEGRSWIQSGTSADLREVFFVDFNEYKADYMLSGVASVITAYFTSIYFNGVDGLQLDTQGGFVQLNADNGSIYLRNGSNGFSLTGGDLCPIDDVASSIGTPLLRVLSGNFYDIFTHDGTIHTSDGTQKQNITEVTLGLDFVKKLHPVEFTWKNETIPATTSFKGEIIPERVIVHSRKHTGLIAQEVEEALSGQDWAGLIKNESGYGLRYNEFMSIIIKALQELNDKVDNL